MPVSITSAAVTSRNGNLAVALPSENPAVMPQEKSLPYLETLQPILQEENKNHSKFCAAAIVVNPSDMVLSHRLEVQLRMISLSARMIPIGPY